MLTKILKINLKLTFEQSYFLIHANQTKIGENIAPLYPPPKPGPIWSFKGGGGGYTPDWGV